jgi:hypothetical protein
MPIDCPLVQESFLAAGDDETFLLPLADLDTRDATHGRRISTHGTCTNTKIP